MRLAILVAALLQPSAAPVRRSGSAGPRHLWLIPKRYSSPETSGLAADVPENGGGEIVLDLRGSPQKE